MMTIGFQKSDDKAKKAVFIFVLIVSLSGLIASLFVTYQYLAPKDNLPSVIELPPFTSGWVGGGRNADQICSPILNKYLAENPKYNIEIKYSEERRTKDNFGKVQYNYTCRFIGLKKP